MSKLQFVCLMCLVTIIFLLAGCAVSSTVYTYNIPSCVKSLDNIINSISTTIAPADWSSEEHNITIVGNVLVIRTTERNGKVVDIKEVQDEDELMLITQRGIIIRQPVKDIKAIGRSTQGVRMINLTSGDRVVDVARVVKSEENNKNSQEPNKTNG